MRRVVAPLSFVVALLAACSGNDAGSGGPSSSTPTGSGGPSGSPTSGGGPDGGTNACVSPPCADGAACLAGSDCASGVCLDHVCAPPSATDGVKNAGETDVDCGGPTPGTPRCADGSACTSGDDCTSRSCSGGTCVAPTSTDGIENGTETDVDCGGGAPTNAPRCADGATCAAGTDCTSLSCPAGTCAAPTSADGVKNGTETDVDCGGGAPTNAPRCASGKACSATADCNDVLCTGNVCQPPTKSDGLQNGTETDVDCGGGAPTNADRCAVDKTCLAHGDCASSACAASGPKQGTCVPFKSCVKDNGGFTCGRDDRDFGGVTNALESCCGTAAIPGSAAKINRFAITAGRMRAFIERLNGNVRGYVQNAATKPSGWQSSWDVLVPSTVDEAEIMLGPYWNDAPNDPNQTAEQPNSKRSCGYAGYNGHTYWVSNQPAASQVFSQAELDKKVLNCVGWHLVNAFCAWDGGRMANLSELRAAFTNGNTTSYPWGNAYNESIQDMRLNHRYIYGYPGNQPVSNRITWWLSPPGRFYTGWNANNVEIAGNVLEWAGDSEYRFAWNMSFEYHTGTMNDGGDWRTPNDRSDVPNGYYALGARCVYP